MFKFCRRVVTWICLFFIVLSNVLKTLQLSELYCKKGCYGFLIIFSKVFEIFSRFLDLFLIKNWIYITNWVKQYIKLKKICKATSTQKNWGWQTFLSIWFFLYQFKFYYLKFKKLLKFYDTRFSGHPMANLIL